MNPLRTALPILPKRMETVVLLLREVTTEIIQEEIKAGAGQEATRQRMLINTEAGGTTHQKGTEMAARTIVMTRGRETKKRKTKRKSLIRRIRRRKTKKTPRKRTRSHLFKVQRRPKVR